MDRKAHWERVFTTTPSARVSWYQETPATSLRLLEAAGLSEHT